MQCLGTGRSHQLRVQCESRGLPIVGDQTYGDFERNKALQLGVIRSFRYSATANRFVDKLDSQGRVNHASALSALYQVTPEVNVYARVARGFRGPTIQGRSAVFGVEARF